MLNDLNKLKFESPILNIEKINSNLAKVKIRIMYAGKNKNGSYFDKEMIIKEMLPTIYNVPIIGYMEDDNFTDHGDRIEVDENGDIEFKNITYAFGLIPESTEITWERFLEDDGVTEHEYLCATGYIWKRFEEECSKILNDGSKHSMEINVFNSEYSKEIEALIIKKAEFSGFCAIGVRPCFEGSKIGGVNSYSNNDLALDFSLLREEINKLLNKEQIQNKEVYELNEENIAVEEVIVESSENSEEIVKPIEILNDEKNEVVIENIEATEDNIQKEVHTEDKETEAEPTNYEELYNELQTKFNELVVKYSSLEDEVVPLRQFKLDVETKENEVKAEMELKEKNDLIESFATKLPKKSIDNIIDDVNKFTLEEIRTKLSVELANQILADTDAKFNDITANIDNMNKSVSREERLIGEIISKKNKLKK